MLEEWLKKKYLLIFLPQLLSDRCLVFAEDGTKETNDQLYADIRIYAEILLSILINRVVFEKMQWVAGLIPGNSSLCE